MSVLSLEVQFHAKLKLSRVKRGGWPAVVTAIAGALAERIDVAEQRCCGGLVKAIEHIEAFRDQIQPNSLAEPNSPHHAEVERSKLMRDAHIASEAAVCEERRENEGSV